MPGWSGLLSSIDRVWHQQGPLFALWTILLSFYLSFHPQFDILHWFHSSLVDSSGVLMIVHRVIWGEFNWWVSPGGNRTLTVAQSQSVPHTKLVRMDGNVGFQFCTTPYFPLKNTFHLILKASIIMSMKQNKKASFKYTGTLFVCVCLCRLCFFYCEICVIIILTL